MIDKCPRCGQQIETHPDGSFVMHATQKGSLCPGTNCRRRPDIKFATIGGVKIPVTEVVEDPDGRQLEDEWPAFTGVK
jgi:hypothetical protein